MQTDVRMTVRLPVEAGAFLDRIAQKNYTSRNAEVVRAIRERMEREAILAAQKEKSGTTA